MANDSTAVVMTFIEQSGHGVPAESRTALHPKLDVTMGTDFEEGCYFEIDEFTLSANVMDEDGNSKNAGGGSGAQAKNTLPNKGKQNTGGSANANMNVPHHAKFEKYLYLGSLPPKDNADLSEISFSRQIDKASPRLLECCLKLIPFKKAVIVKRKVTGDEHHQIFLRMEFKEPLITSVGWDDGETVKEKVQFVCRGLKVQYIPQNDDGSIGTQTVPMDWAPQPRK